MNKGPSSNQSEKQKFALVPRPPSEIEKAEPGAKRVLSGMIADAIELARRAASKEVTVPATQLEDWYRMGQKYLMGVGVPEDCAEAIVWYRKAAEHGHATAQYALGQIYFGTENAEAAKWFLLAAEQGNADAQGRLGILYLNGRNGVPQNYAEAVKWFRKAAEQGDAYGQDLLAHCYYDGRGVSQDYIEAANWFQKAADQNWPLAQWSLGKMYRDGKGVLRDLAEAFKWLRLATDGINTEQFTGELASLQSIANREELQEGERRYREFKANH